MTSVFTFQFSALGRQKLKDALVSMSLANLCYLDIWRQLIYSPQLEYFSPRPYYPPKYAAALLNVLLIGAVFWLGITLARLSGRAWAVNLARLAFLVLLLLPLNFVRQHVLHLPLASLFSHGKTAVASGMVLAAALLVPGYKWITHWARNLLLGMFLLVPVHLLMTSWDLCAAFARYSPDTESALRIPNPVLASGHHQSTNPAIQQSNNTHQSSNPTIHQSGAPAAARRVVWIIFDELDQSVAFEQRPPGLRLPELDRLADESLVATNAFPPAGCTELSMPSLICGRVVSRVRITGSSELELNFGEYWPSAGWSTVSNVFSRASVARFGTALVGWYHPYSRVLKSSLDYCCWKAFPGYAGTTGEGLLGCQRAQFKRAFWPLDERMFFLHVYSDLMHQSLRLVADSRYGLVLLHLSVPHLPGIYDPAISGLSWRTFSLAAAYRRNLCLVDRAVGQIRHVLEEGGLWDHTTFLVSSDHWWRKENGHTGIIDYRVPFLLKLADSKKVAFCPTRFNTAVSADLILANLSGKLQTAEEVCYWLREHECKAAPHYDRDGCLVSN